MRLITSIFFPGILKLKLNYTYTKSIDKNPDLPESENQLLRRPAHKAGFNLYYTPIEKAVVKY